MRLFLMCLVLMTGCTTTVGQIPHQPQNSALQDYNSIDDVLKAHFTAEAYDLIKDIPTVVGNTINPFVSGVNRWSDLGSFLLLNGVGRQVIVGSDDLVGSGGLRTLVHEYVHHIDDMTRDGLANLIDHREYMVAFYLLKQDPRYKEDATEIEEKANWIITDIFGIGPYSEHIAYTASWLIDEGGPDYMWHPFRRILRKPATHS